MKSDSLQPRLIRWARQLKYHVELISQEKEQLSSILTSMADAVITFNRDGTILLSNPQAEKLLQKWFFANDAKNESVPPELLHMLEHSITFSEEVEDELELNRSILYNFHQSFV